MITTHEPTLHQLETWLSGQDVCCCQQQATQAVVHRLASGKYRTHFACAECGEKLNADHRAITRLDLSRVA